MFDIVGKYGTAVCYADTVEQEAVDQIERMLDYDICPGSRVRIMPDVHAGAGCTIGTTMTIGDRVVPNIVGVDIGCGMYTVQLYDKTVDLKKLDKVVHDIPSGINVWDEVVEEFPRLEDLYCFEELKNVDRLRKSLGSLGGGNHFIELDRGSRGTYFLVIHSGSRNLGKQVAEYYQKMATKQCNGDFDWKEKQERVISELKAAGRSKDIQKELKKLKSERVEKEIPDDLCYVKGEWMKKYLHDLDICQRFACRNREIIADKIISGMVFGVRTVFHTIHNYVDMDENGVYGEKILRKGAISARKREMLLIPLNMRDGSILGCGLGNPEWNFSAPHGAGRVMGRNEARRKLSVEQYIECMKEAGVYSTSVGEETLDEAPMVYKNPEEIIESVKDTVMILDILKPVYNFKARDDFYERSEDEGGSGIASGASVGVDESVAEEPRG